MTEPLTRAKAIGYATEIAALKELKGIFPSLRRVGSPGYSASHPDLVQGSPTVMWSIPLVVTRDMRQPLIASLYVSDLVLLADADYCQDLGVGVQCKHRERTQIGTLLSDLNKVLKI